MAKNQPAPAAPAPAAPVAPAPTAPATAATPEKTVKTRIAPQLTAISAAVPMPKKTVGKRGSVSPYPFDDLTEVGMSFGVKNKEATGMASIISNQNRNAQEPKKDAAGNPVTKKDAAGNVIFKKAKMKDAAGNLMEVPTEEPEIEMVATKHFFAIAVDPNTDPDGAKVRVFRDK